MGQHNNALHYLLLVWAREGSMPKVWAGGGCLATEPKIVKIYGYFKKINGKGVATEDFEEVISQFVPSPRPSPTSRSASGMGIVPNLAR